jgi:hypothetical protein
MKYSNTFRSELDKVVDDVDYSEAFNQSLKS